jgi:hypothetical protein
MSDLLNSISIFGLHGVLIREGQGADITKCNPNKLVSNMFRGHIRDPKYVVGVITDISESAFTPTWMWLLKNFKVTSQPKPTYLMIHDRFAHAAHLSAGQNLSTIISKHPNCQRISCVDASDVVLSQYKDIIQRSGIPMWRLHKVTENSIEQYATSFIDKV